MFYALDLIESYGSGIRRAKEALEKNKSPKMVFYPENSELDYTLVNVPINKYFLEIKNNEDLVLENLTGNLSDIDLLILKTIKDNPKISIKKLSEVISKSYSSTKDILKIYQK